MARFDNTYTSKSAIEEFPVGPGYVGIGVSTLPFTYQKVNENHIPFHIVLTAKLII